MQGAAGDEQASPAKRQNVGDTTTKTPGLDGKNGNGGVETEALRRAREEALEKKRLLERELEALNKGGLLDYWRHSAATSAITQPSSPVIPTRASSRAPLTPAAVAQTPAATPTPAAALTPAAAPARDPAATRSSTFSSEGASAGSGGASGAAANPAGNPKAAEPAEEKKPAVGGGEGEASEAGAEGGSGAGAGAEGGSSRGEGGKAGATVGEKRKGLALLTDEEKLILVKAKVSAGRLR